MYAYGHAGILLPQKKTWQQSADHQPIERIAIMVAMPAEAEAILKFSGLNFSQTNHLNLKPHYHLQSYHCQIKQRDIFLIVNGIDPEHDVAQVGTINAALFAEEVIDKVKPDTIISAGTAGGCNPSNCMIGDIFISEGSFMFHDRRIPIPQYEDYGKGYLPCLSAPFMAKQLHLKTGTFSTGNSLSTSDTDKQVLQEINAEVKEMEVAAIADVARRHFNTIRVMGVKAITNVANSSPSAEFQKNFNCATTNLAHKLPHIIKFMLGLTPAELLRPVIEVRS